MDATFFGTKRSCDGIFVAKDVLTKAVVYYEFISSETIATYVRCIDTLQGSGYSIYSITIDGKSGVLTHIQKSYPHIALQTCQFHVQQVVQRKLTKKPILAAAIQLLALSRTLTYSSEEQVMERLLQYYRIHHTTLYEQYYDDTHNTYRYVRPKLVSAFKTLLTALAYLYTYQKQQHTIIPIPHTTNHLDGYFSWLKQETVLIHRGLRRDRRDKLIVAKLAG
jgi:transposase-like protein